MKSNVSLLSESRELLGRKITVISKDGFVCMTEVMDALADKRASLGLAPRRLDDLMGSKSFQEKMISLVKELNANNICNAVKVALQDSNMSINKMTDLKKYGMAYRRGKGKEQKWFVDPYFFVMVALELDPEIYAKVVVWLTDGFIEVRNAAGEAYIKMSSSVATIVGFGDDLRDKIRRVARAINFIVFNKHEDGIRNSGTKNQLNEILEIEISISALISVGYIKTFDDLINYLGNEWRKRWGNPILSLK